MNGQAMINASSAQPGAAPRGAVPMMKAAVYQKFGPPEVVQLAETPKPTPRPDEVLIKVLTSTVSIADHRARSRKVPRGLGAFAAYGLGLFRPRHPVLGMDAAGVVEAVGENVTRFQPGDEVIAMLGGAFGGHAEYVCVQEDSAITAKPRAMTFEEAVTLVFGGITARGYLNQVVVKPGDRVLVNGASGAVGTAVVQLVHELGAHVTAVCSGANAELVAALGADQVIDYTSDDFTAPGERYDVIVDCVGNVPLKRMTASVKPDGALLLVIADLTGLLRASRRRRRSGLLVTASVGKSKSEDLAFLVGLAEAGRYQAVIDRTYDLADIVEAHRYVDTGRKKGSVVLRISG
jgi:NADPH:quinone reductase-like Zn-dependent oxidoreductase